MRLNKPSIPMSRATLRFPHVLLFCAAVACQPGEKKAAPGETPAPASTSDPAAASPSAAPSAQASATAGEKPTAKEVRGVLATPVPQPEIDKIVNPKNLAPYSGPTGGVRGIVRITGDPPLAHADVVRAIAPDCTRGKGTYGKTPREGEGRAVADVLVAVTGYEGFVPQKEATRIVRGVGCAWEARTIALTFGQTLRIAAGDNRAYVPDLLGQKMAAQLFAMPGAEPVSLPPRKPGRYTLIDAMRLYSAADVFVVPYPTFAVTGLDGKFEVSGVPVGKVKVNALLPATMAVVEREVEIKAGETIDLELSLSFDAKAYKALKVE